MAPSALGKRAEINPRMKIMEIKPGIWYMASVGKRSSPFVEMPSFSAYR
jgi:hypothetical protein